MDEGKRDVTDSYPEDTLPGLKRYHLLIVGTPPFAQEEHVRIALEAGIPVLCEKPCGLSVYTPRRLARDSRRSGVPVGVNYQLRFNEDIVLFRDKLAAFHPTTVRLLYNSGARKDVAHKPYWYCDARIGGGLKFSVLCHLIDLVCFFGYSFETVHVQREARLDSEALSNTEFPFNNIEVNARLDCDTSLNIRVNTESNYARFVIAVGNGSDLMALDVISGKVICERDAIRKLTLHDSTLLESSSSGPWSSSFATLISHVTNKGLKQAINLEDCATLDQAASVHRVIEAMSQSWRLRHAVPVRRRWACPSAAATG